QELASSMEEAGIGIRSYVVPVVGLDMPLLESLRGPGARPAPRREPEPRRAPEPRVEPAEEPEAVEEDGAQAEVQPQDGETGGNGRRRRRRRRGRRGPDDTTQEAGLEAVAEGDENGVPAGAAIAAAALSDVTVTDEDGEATDLSDHDVDAEDHFEAHD